MRSSGGCGRGASELDIALEGCGVTTNGMGEGAAREL